MKIDLQVPGKAKQFNAIQGIKAGLPFVLSCKKRSRAYYIALKVGLEVIS